MRQKIVLTAFLLLVSTGAFAQSEDMPHSDISFGIGAAVPNGADRAYLNNAPMIAFGYGYRFNRYFQAEGAFQMAFGAANNQNPEESEYGQVQGGDHEFLIPLTARFIVPLPLRKWQVSVGGGPAFLHYAETGSSDTYYCFTCTSRGGFGLQGSAKIRYLLGDEGTYFIGTNLQYFSASVNGDPVGNIPGTKTRDRWTNALIEIGVRF
jgi:hypothetical protein